MRTALKNVANKYGMRHDRRPPSFSEMAQLKGRIEELKAHAPTLGASKQQEHLDYLESWVYVHEQIIDFFAVSALPEKFLSPLLACLTRAQKNNPHINCATFRINPPGKREDNTVSPFCSMAGSGGQMVKFDRADLGLLAEAADWRRDLDGMLTKESRTCEACGALVTNSTEDGLRLHQASPRCSKKPRI